MPKIKTNRSAAKRFYTISGGGIKRLLNYKKKTKLNLNNHELIARANLKTIKRLLPNL